MFSHQSVDPIIAGSHLVQALQTIVSRNAAPVDGAVVTQHLRSQRGSVGPAHDDVRSRVAPANLLRDQRNASVVRRSEETSIGT